ncbi:hypothetical protein M0R04_11260 [Candidatus Dojkabacteria bacterium]|jgi:RimJ/RimL family protein N-acetyltransferase|nr:hypothetical protein [Candidatus Dojkabacteria bacterium]
MNKEDREHLDRIEGKIDVINERSIRTEDKVSAHLDEHAKRVRYALAMLGTFGLAFTVFLVKCGKWIWIKLTD